MKYYSIILGLLIGWITNINAVAADLTQSKETFFLGKDLSLAVALQPGYIQGDTTYRITFAGGASELEFPLQHSLLGFEISLGHKELGMDNEFKSKLVFNFSTNLSSEAGKMEDSDWIDNDVDFFNSLGKPGYQHPGKDIYSESDASLKAKISDLSYALNLSSFQNTTVAFISGYRIQKFEYQISDTQQVGYGPYAPYFTGNVSGKSLEYRVRYEFPYWGVKINALLKDQNQGNIFLGFSNWVTAEDLDDHLLRSKIGKADCTGSAFMISLGLQGVVKPQWFIQFNTSYLGINTSGTQLQQWYGDDSASPGFDDTGSSTRIKDKITASIWMSHLSISYRF